MLTQLAMALLIALLKFGKLVCHKILPVTSHRQEAVQILTLSIASVLHRNLLLQTINNHLKYSVS